MDIEMTKKCAYTKGPWAVSDILDNGSNCVVTARPNESQGEIIVGTASNLTLADARLIAAAPDLLAALIKISDTAMSWPQAGVTCGEMARAAIAKMVKP